MLSAFHWVSCKYGFASQKRPHLTRDVILRPRNAQHLRRVGLGDPGVPKSCAKYVVEVNGQT